MDNRYRRTPDGKYYSHRPIYGFGVGPSERNHTLRFGISFSILKVLNRLQWNTLLDVGGGEGYIAHFARDLFHKEAYTMELSTEANLRAREFFGLSGITADIHRSPFKDRTFDIVLASEVIEHLQYPELGLYEIARVASKAVILTTAEAYFNKRERDLRLKIRNLSALHSERNYWHPDDFRRFFEGEVRVLNCTTAFMDIDERSATVDEARSLVREMSSLTDFNDEGFDAMIVIPKGGFNFNQPALSDDVILDRLFDFKLDPDKISQTIQNLPENLFVCPACKNELKNEDNGWFCLNCAEKYLKVENVPVFISSRPVQKPEQQSLINAGVDPAGFEYIKNIFKPEYLRASPMLKATYVLGLMFHLLVRFVRSRVPWRIKYKWFVNKVGLSTIRSYYFK